NHERVVVFAQNENLPRLPTDVSVSLHRVAQEALRNALTHSGATYIHVQLTASPTTGRLSVKDNGCGFVMADANLGCGAPRIHGELLKLGIEVSERTVSRLMPKRNTAPSQTWRAFLDNHIRDLVSIDFFTVPTARLRVLFVFIVLSHERRRVIHFNTTEH